MKDLKVQSIHKAYFYCGHYKTSDENVTCLKDILFFLDKKLITFKEFPIFSKHHLRFINITKPFLCSVVSIDKAG